MKRIHGQQKNVPRMIGVAVVWLVVGGFNPSEKYEKVNWDDCSQYMEKLKLFQTTNQPAVVSMPQSVV